MSDYRTFYEINDYLFDPAECLASPEIAYVYGGYMDNPRYNIPNAYSIPVRRSRHVVMSDKADELDAITKAIQGLWAFAQQRLRIVSTGTDDPDIVFGGPLVIFPCVMEGKRARLKERAPKCWGRLITDLRDYGFEGYAEYLNDRTRQ